MEKKKTGAKTELVSKQRRLSSVGTAIQLVKAFSEEQVDIDISELSRRLGVAKSTVHRLAATLAAEGLLEQDQETECGGQSTAASGACDFRQLRGAMLPGGLHEAREQRVPVARRRGELRVELGRHEPRMSR